MKALEKLIEGTDCHLHEIIFHSFAGHHKGFCITKPNVFTGWEYEGEAEIMVFEPNWDTNYRTGRIEKLWMVTIHKAFNAELGFKMIWIKPHRFIEELKKYLQ